MYLLFDIGGTKTRIALSYDMESFDNPIIIPTSQNYNDGILMFKKVVSDISKGGKIKIIAGGIRGILNKEKTMLENDHILRNWIKKPLKNDLENIFKAKAYIRNDAEIVGLGEAVYGAGKGNEIVAYITVSTGVGGARIVSGKIDKNRFGFEPGHQIIDIKNNKSLEDLISGISFEKRENKKLYEIYDLKIWDNFARIFAFGLYNTILHWSPDIVVLGGSIITGNHGINIENVKKYLNEINTKFLELSKIKKAELGDIGGIYGALAFIKNILKKN